MAFRLSSLIAVLGFTAAVAGCAPYPLHANMTDAEIRARVQEHFHTGMTRASVNGTLTELRVSERYRLLYPAEGEHPEVLLARLYQPGGAWVRDEDSVIEFVDLSFIFTKEDALSGVSMFRDGIRYFRGGRVNAPAREPLAPLRDWPSTPPPPRDPLDRAEPIPLEPAPAAPGAPTSGFPNLPSAMCSLHFGPAQC